MCLRADEDSEVEVLANVEEAPLTRDDSGIMLRQQCIELLKLRGEGEISPF